MSNTFRLYKTKGGNKPVNVSMSNQPATVKQVRKIVKKALHKDEEEKYAIVQASYSVNTTCGIYNIANTSQGSSGGTHVGDECRLKSIWFRWQMGVADVTNVMRIIIFV